MQRLIDEALRAALAIFLRLAREGRAEIAYPKPLAYSAAAHVTARGRRRIPRRY